MLASKSVNFSEIPATIMLNQVIVGDGVTSITWTLRNDDDAKAGERPRDSEGRCVCTYAPSSVFVRPGASQSFDAVFKALPDGVTTIDVVIPRAGTFREVQVQR
ncbi:hypothetical protein [Micropruina glycogenica]|uniref:Uncharacterized protein n=1 Tax=Micropruina glycogenica TaxID=75385 RepID=A0A2N9JF72_9ACTN|nr:hypothetical protein [Micropruina glycogenica]SPD86757.1 protein of unknown function [Micropruina glycogenica]